MSATGRSGPIRIELRFPQNDLRIWNTSEIDKAVRPLLEKEWSYVSDWDIPLSIKATIRNGGMPTFHRRRRKTTPQYILLIDQKSPRDHLAGLYADLGAELRRRDVAVEWFFYDHIPYRCWRDRREPSSFTNVERLATEFDGRAVVGKLDVDANQEFAAKYGVRNIPTVLIFQNGEVVGRQVGVAPKKTYTDAIDGLL